MTKEEKELLLKDLSARLLYKPKVKVLSFWNEDKEVEEDIVDSVYCVTPDGYINTETIDSDISLDNIILYLRPMSSMTEEERLQLTHYAIIGDGHIAGVDFVDWVERKNVPSYIDWLNAHHFDYRGLIERGLGIDCTGLNIYENEKFI